MSYSTDPYQNPQYPPLPQKIMCRVAPSEPVPSSFAIGEFLQESWEIGIKCWQPFLIMGLIVGGANFVIWMGSYLCSLVSFFVVSGLMQQSDTANVGMIIAIAGIVLTALLVASLILVWLYAGQVAYSLAIVRGEQPPVSVLFSGMKNFWGVLIAGANITVIFLCVLFVLFLPGFVLILFYVSNPQPLPVFLTLSMIMLFGCVYFVAFLFLTNIFCLTYFFVVDRQQGPVEAMKSSCRFVWTQFWSVLGSVLLILVCLMAAGMIPFVGMFLCIPVSLCLYTVLYLKITGQRHGLIVSDNSGQGRPG